LRNRFANDDKNVPEQKAMAVDASTGYEEPFKDIDRPNIESASETEKNLQKKRENVSDDFSKTNRGQDVTTESERAKKLEQRLNEAEEERTILRQEIEDLSNTVKVLKEKSTPELLKELQEKFADTPGLIDAKKLQKISMEAGKHLILLMKKYNAILQEAVERGKPVPVATYIMTKPEQKLVPVNIYVDFDRRIIKMLLWEKRLQGLS
jgi:seryl-tRNA synthetase